MAGRNYFLNAAYALPILLLYQECYPSPRSTPSWSRSRWPPPPKTTVTPAPDRPKTSLLVVGRSRWPQPPTTTSTPAHGRPRTILEGRSGWPLHSRTTAIPAHGRPRTSLVRAREVKVATATKNYSDQSSCFVMIHRTLSNSKRTDKYRRIFRPVHKVSTLIRNENEIYM